MKLKAFLMRVIVGSSLIFPFSANALDYTYQLNDFSTTTLKITGYTGPGGAITIPSVINGTNVTVIGDFAFSWRSSLTSVTIPASIVDIGEQAFVGCSGLTTITLPSSLTHIGAAGFSGCKFSSVVVSANNIIFASMAFMDCNILTRICFAGNAPGVGDNVFYNANSTTLYYLPGTTGWTNTVGGRPIAPWLTLNGGTATPPYTDLQHVSITAGTPPAGKVFYQWTGAAQYVASVTSSTTTVSMPAAPITLTATYGDQRYGLTVVRGTGGGSYTNQQNVAIAADVPSAGVYFDRWTGDTQYVANATASNTTFSMPARDAAVTAMYRSDFVCTTNNGKLTVTGYTGAGGSITIPETINGLSVASILTDVFMYFDKSTVISVTVPSGVTNIGSGAFTGCANLTGIQVSTNNSFFSSTSGVLFNKNQTQLLQCPGAKSGTYAIPDSVVSIGPSAFAFCTNLTGVTASSGIKEIGSGAFQYCQGLTNLPIGSGVTNIGSYAFYRCTAVTNLVVPASIISISDSAFANCTGLTNVVLGSGVQSLGMASFAYCTSLKTVMVPSSLTNLGAYAFSPYTALTGIYFAGNAPFAGPDVFHQDNSTTVYYMPGTTGWTNSFVSRPTALWLTLNGGSVQGPHTNLQQVAITTDTPIGKSFYRWTGATQYVAGVTSSTTTVSMPLQAIALTAEYQTIYYPLTVQNGSGSGSYAYQQQVAITADAPAAGYVFDQWTGATQYVADVQSASTTVTMPAQAAALTATYKVAYYTLTISNGSGSGEYTNQQQVAIAADAPAVGYAFDRWTGDTQCVANVSSSSTTVTMPAQEVALTATFKVVYYTLTVSNGSGSGEYTNQQQVAITADAPVAGCLFDQWTGDTQCVADIHSASTTVTMPAQGIVLTATYKTAYYYTLTVNSGSGSGSYTNQQQVVITAGSPLAQMTFNQWTGDTQYVASVTSATTTVTMPATNITVTANYRPLACVKEITGFQLVSANSGTLVNGPVWTDGKYGGGLSFSNGKYVSVPSPSPDIFNITGDLTIALWVNPNTVTCSGADPAYDLVSKRLTNIATPYELYIGNGGTVCFNYWAVNIAYPIFAATGTISTGMWQHVAVTRSFSGATATVAFYINGVESGSSTAASGLAKGSSGPVLISRGGYHPTYTTQGTYSGLMDDVQIYNHALSASEISRVFSNDCASIAGRVGSWKLDEGSGTTVADTIAIGTVNEGAKTVTATVPVGTGVTSMAPVIAVSPRATVDPASGSAQNFSHPVTYTVTAEDSTTQGYTVWVIYEGSDIDENGLPDLWEQQYFDVPGASPTNLCSNGINTVLQAYIAGLDPNNPSAYFDVTAPAWNILQWNAVSGRVCDIYWATNLLSGFQCLESNIPWPQCSATNSASGSCGYYKVNIRLAE